MIDFLFVARPRDLRDPDYRQAVHKGHWEYQGGYVMVARHKVVAPPAGNYGQGCCDGKRTERLSTCNMKHECLDSKDLVPSAEISRLFHAGFSLLPLGGGADGKSPLTSYEVIDGLPLKRVLGILHANNSANYGIRLKGLAVVDCDENDPELALQMEARSARPRCMWPHRRAFTSIIAMKQAKSQPSRRRLASRYQAGFQQLCCWPAQHPSRRWPVSAGQRPSRGR